MSDTTAAILDAAERRIRVAGYNGFSFREIAADVGVKSSSVHYHFPTKESLAVAVARRYIDRFMLAIDQETGEGHDIIETWTQSFRRSLLHDGRMCLCVALGATPATLSGEVLEEVRRFFQLAREKLVTGGLSPQKAAHVLACLEGAMLAASILSAPSFFDDATASLALGTKSTVREAHRHNDAVDL
ncbi:TetR/AcrR family transcriptional regulator [Methyloligella sp. 2.7D]|uniref:TetR/AcrR family transcriptional regulator n=1 Tax=unclassified Methyloligella TaxID=2625955 RepID=UPI00157DEE14|nr:TetR/AcrR family transcriptional regulator [Methyloligella sp. GL2]QKP76621.1 TetR/AcrR family transcriptional regulator [Methyloligella sp. GL2]